MTLRSQSRPYLPSAHLRRLVRGSTLIASAAQCREANPLGWRLRALAAAETLELERQGCHCDDWTRVRVQEGFETSAVRECVFEGDVTLARFSGTVMLPGRVSLPTGLRRAHIRDAAIGNCCVQDVGLVVRQVLHDAAVVFRVGSLVSSGSCSFATGHRVGVGLETGGREIPLFAEMDVELAAWLAFHPCESPERRAFEEALSAHAETVRHGVGVVGEGAVLCNTVNVRNAWIGPHARIDGAQLVRDAAILSHIESPTMVRDGAIVEHAVLQPGVQVRSHAIVRKSLLCEASGASRHAKITQAVLGPNTEIQEGEVTSSLVGPLVGFHHQSLLIAALWPEGRGNVGHGAALGSNHTGRRADQELWPGEGQFFGLCSQVKFPANFQDSPWSLVATGAVVQPGRYALPFSLFPQETREGRPLLRPGWMWLHNAYALERSEAKLSERDRTRGKVCQKPFLHEDLLERVEAAREALRRFSAGESLPEAGPCRVEEPDRKEGLQAYTECLHLGSLRALAAGQPSSLADWAEAFLAREFPGETRQQLLSRLPGLERLWVRRVRRSRERDDRRGADVFDDYASTHVSAREDDVVRTAATRARETARTLREASAG